MDKADYKQKNILSLHDSMDFLTFRNEQCWILFLGLMVLFCHQFGIPLHPVSNRFILLLYIFTKIKRMIRIFILLPDDKNKSKHLHHYHYYCLYYYTTSIYLSQMTFPAQVSTALNYFNLVF